MRQRTKLFVDFLKENKCYSQYKDNFFRFGHYDSFADFIHYQRSINWIDAFHWEETSEGFNYWYFKYCDWLRIVECLDK